MVKTRRSLSDGARRILQGRHHDPFDILGCHRRGRYWYIKALVPGAEAMEVLLDEDTIPMERIPETDLFSARLTSGVAPGYRLRRRSAQGQWFEYEDPYRFSPVIGDLDLHEDVTERQL